MTEKARPRSGGRSARIQSSVHLAVESLLAEMGRSALTIPLIADRAGVTPSTIYRRWGDLAELLGDVAVQRLRPVSDPVDTGSMSGDLQAWSMQFADEMSSVPGRTMLRDIFAGTTDSKNPSHCCSFTDLQLGVINRRAIDRGKPGFDVDLFIDRVVAPILYRILFRDMPPSTDYCQQLVSSALAINTGQLMP